VNRFNYFARPGYPVSTAENLRSIGIPAAHPVRCSCPPYIGWSPRNSRSVRSYRVRSTGISASRLAERFTSDNRLNASWLRKFRRRTGLTLFWLVYPATPRGCQDREENLQCFTGRRGSRNVDDLVCGIVDRLGTRVIYSLHNLTGCVRGGCTVINHSLFSSRSNARMRPGLRPAADRFDLYRIADNAEPTACYWSAGPRLGARVEPLFELRARASFRNLSRLDLNGSRTDCITDNAAGFRGCLLHNHIS